MEDDGGVSMERACLADFRVDGETHEDREWLRFRRDRRRWKSFQEK